MSALWLPVLAFISTAFVSTGGSALPRPSHRNASDANAIADATQSLPLVDDDNSTRWSPAAAAAAAAAAPNATARSNLTRTIDGSVDQADCFYFCPTWTNVFVICLMILLLTCLCGAITQHQPREVWYVVDRSGGEPPRAAGQQPPIPPKMLGPPPQPQQQMQLRSP